METQYKRFYINVGYVKYEIKCCFYPNNVSLPKEHVTDDYAYSLVKVNHAGSLFAKNKVTKMAISSRHGWHISLVRKLVRII